MVTPSVRPPPRPARASTAWSVPVLPGARDHITKELTIARAAARAGTITPVRFFVVRSGTLTHDEEDCTVDGIYQAGQAISERSGPGYIHEAATKEPSLPLVGPSSTRRAPVATCRTRLRVRFYGLRSAETLFRCRPELAFPAIRFDNGQDW